MIRNAISALMNKPYRKCEPLTLKKSLLKSGFPPIAAINGVTKLAVNAVTTAPNAAPMTTATARSTTLPRSRNFLNPLNEASSGLVDRAHSRRVARRARRGLHLEQDLLRIAVEPVLIRFEAADHGMPAAACVRGGVPVGRGVATADAAARLAHPQAHPRRPLAQAGLAAVAQGGEGQVEFAQVFARYGGTGPHHQRRSSDGAVQDRRTVVAVQQIVAD